MKVEEQNNFEEEWRKAFENAAMTPSEELWGRIESELDKKKKRPFLFFLKPSLMATGLAAALALVLGGILFFNETPKADIAQTNDRIVKDQNASGTMPENRLGVSPTGKATTNNPSLIATKESKTSGTGTPDLKNSRITIAANSNIAASKRPETSVAVYLLPTDGAGKSGIAGLARNTNENSVAVTAEPLLASAHNLGSPEKLDSKKYSHFGSRYTMKRNKLAFDAETDEESPNTALAANESKFWVGLQSGVAPFDPNMKLGNLNSMAYSAASDYAQLTNASNSPSDKGSLSVSRPRNDVKNGVAINSGIAFGVRVSKKWHIESGVRYLRGNSTLETNTYAFQNNGYVNTFLGNYLLQNSAQNYSQVKNSNTVVADASQFGNRYEYLMIPMQMAYEVGLTKKMSLNLLAGFSTDIFLQNSIFTDKGLVRGKNTINSENNIYKPVNFSGLGGVRASYMLNRHWQANIGTSYQRALFSGMTSAVNINMQMQMFGINYGFNYRF
ncbi:hypothetical protein [Emticicia sp. 21SJ11W-3]|uniref:hypothetical protein n=1 Tax=Emticicia sp. 21SJ11W-3 TaxID=2916755 RepID=UPI00209CB212|nr:hypothetical protein [Emticicia sp. 21SJ11W-3]UTA68032.1 hypothetical protein MB380_20910 [Emticicia sp. 21SJ11W-3]